MTLCRRCGKGTDRREPRGLAAITLHWPEHLQKAHDREKSVMIGDPTKLVIRARFPRLSAAALAPFRERSTSFVVDAMNGRGALSHDIKPLDPSSRFVGSALTARAGARDNLAALAALDLIERGDVLVIATQGFSGTATLGDNMARIARMRGAVGIVTDGMVRDAAEIIALGIPVFCRGVTPNSAFPSGPGEVALPLAMGEVTVDAGDLVIGDRDGVVVVPRAHLEEVTKRLELVAAREAEMHAKVAAGEIRSVLDRYRELREQITYLN
jgi:4-hydroxy-4-methyl-2-oxoglutarate aldolase